MAPSPAIPSVAERLLRYVRYDTQSDESSKTVPSTAKQLELSKVLLAELQALGLSDAAIDEYGYVMATIPSTVKHAVPVIGLIAHVDTAPDLTGTNVNPQLHPNYQGGAIRLNDEYALTPERSPELMDHIGHTIVTTDGTTLLGADNKAGVAEIMTLAERLIADPKIPHGKIRIAFTHDEEIGRGTQKFDLKKFAADYAYTVDGETIGVIENETFCADSAKISIQGVSVHPGFAKDKLVNALKIAAQIVDQLPGSSSPEKTSDRQGYLHPIQFQGSSDYAEVKFILRAFEERELAAQRTLLRELAQHAERDFPGSKVTVEISESYRNMRFILDQHPQVAEHALEATRRAGITPKLGAIRGGTDGAHLTYAGLPTPNIFTGGHMYHSRYEWVAVEGMLATVDTLVELAKLWAERALQK